MILKILAVDYPKSSNDIHKLEIINMKYEKALLPRVVNKIN